MTYRKASIGELVSGRIVLRRIVLRALAGTPQTAVPSWSCPGTKICVAARRHAAPDRPGWRAHVPRSKGPLCGRGEKS